VKDIPKEILTSVEKKFHHQIQPLIKRFPELNTVAEFHADNPENSAYEYINLAAPMAALQKELPEIVLQIREHATELRDQGRNDYLFCKLLDTLGIDFIEPKQFGQLPSLNEQQRKILRNTNSQPADCLREIAKMLERQGLLKDALFAISCSLDRRPNGPALKAIKERLEKKLAEQKLSRVTVCGNQQSKAQ
jgi:hypothetical protein